jgi:predicted xylose isomerase-like sugar epimerase
VAYLAMEASPELEFEFFLAQKLGMTVVRLRAEMPADEFVGWVTYYARKAQREELEAAKVKG